MSLSPFEGDTTAVYEAGWITGMDTYATSFSHLFEFSTWIAIKWNFYQVFSLIKANKHQMNN
jgi:hypothetical protein